VLNDIKFREIGNYVSDDIKRKERKGGRKE
jgi:hypothetical protein